MGGLSGDAFMAFLLAVFACGVLLAVFFIGREIFNSVRARRLASHYAPPTAPPRRRADSPGHGASHSTSTHDANWSASSGAAATATDFALNDNSSSGGGGWDSSDVGDSGGDSNSGGDSGGWESGGGGDFGGGGAGGGWS